VSTFSDYFSETAPSYATHRPHYPASLFAWLAAQTETCTRAWDCGTGSGQAAQSLAPLFVDVLASDPSYAQVSHAVRISNVTYAVMTAESAAIDDRSMNLVTVAQALHWFELQQFFAEVRRVLVPGGVIAAWTYKLLSIDPEIDAVLNVFYSETMGPFWPPERALVDAGYRSIRFPFREIEPPTFVMEAAWTLGHLRGFLDTWSAVTRYRKALGTDPVAGLIDELAGMWGRPDVTRRVTWPLELRVGSV